MKKPTKKYLEQVRKLLELVAECIETINEKEAEEENLLYELKYEYNSFFEWALNVGADEELMDTEEAEKTWKKAHPDLPVPRVCFMKNKVDHYTFTMLFLMDAYPLYVEHKKNK